MLKSSKHDLANLKYYTSKRLHQCERNYNLKQPELRCPRYAQLQRGYAYMMEKASKWSVRFDGSKGALQFLDRVEELANVYDMQLDWLPRTMPELLKDRALLWHKNCNKRWETWKAFKEDFIRFFLSARYFDHLEDTIRERQQRQKETFNEYVFNLIDLMRPTSYDTKRKLERIYRNSRQEFQLQIKRREFITLEELMSLVDDYEEVIRANKDANRQSHSVTERLRQLTEPKNTINPSTACRRCS